MLPFKKAKSSSLDPTVASEQPLRQHASGFFDWFAIGLVGLLLFSLAIRFWGLGRFNTLVFDEVYYVKFAKNYLTQTPFFDGHPPLSKYLIAIGIWLGNQLPIGRDAVNTMAGLPFSSWSYRWLNTLMGSFIPLIISGIALQLTHRRSYAWLAGLFAALDGLLLVESRYALNNVHLLLFGLLGLWFFLLALKSRSGWRDGWLAAAGICFGAATAIKWNGLWFLLGAYGVWIAAWVARWLQSLRPAVLPLLPSDRLPPDQSSEVALEAFPEKSPLQQLTQLRLWQILLNLAVVPAVFYYLAWLPHLRLNPEATFWGLQQQILTYHEQVGDGPNIHPYCARWYTWILMLRPVAYFYQVTYRGDPLPTGNSALPATPDSVLYDVHAIGNPALWWLSTLGMILMVWMLVQGIDAWLATKSTAESPSLPSLQPPIAHSTELWLALFLLVNYGANLLPWVKVTRCTFLYHYMGASVFASLAIAWFCDRWLRSSDINQRMMGIAAILMVFLAFLFWLPIFLGLPLSLAEFKLRMWLPSWV